MVSEKEKHNLNQISKNLCRAFLILLLTIGVAICLRVFLFDTYIIPTPSMEPAILSGDHVVVNKLIPGPRLVKNYFSLRKGVKPLFTRLPGWKVMRNDVLVFNIPYTEEGILNAYPNQFYAKRCVAVPGDTFYIRNGYSGIVNGEDIPGCNVNQQLLSQTSDTKISPDVFRCFPYDSRYDWNIKDFGPLYIPRNGDVVAIDTLNMVLYQDLITYESGKQVRAGNGVVMLGDSMVHEYKFLQDYYFMAGDNVMNSRDSRYWGLLPGEYIAGKVAFVWNNKEAASGRVKWDRFLKRVK